MPLVVKDRVRETSTTTGTGTFTLAGAVTGYQSFSAVGNGNTTYYTIYLQGGNEWEVGIGTYTASGTTLSRDTILASSNAGSAVNFSAGVKDVFVTYPADRSVWYDTATNVTLNALTVTGALAANGGTTIGDASGDAFTINSSAVSVPNGLNFDSNTLVIDAANDRVGIGTNSPFRKLDIALTPAAQVTGATIRSVGGTTSIGDETSIDFQVFSTSYYNGRISGYVESIIGNGKGGLKFYTSSAGNSINATPSVTIDSSGNVGIGTDAPAAPLSFASATGQKIRFYNALTGYGIGVESSEFRFVTDNSAVFTWGVGTYASPTERMRLDTSGTLILRQSSNAANTSVSLNTTIQNALTLEADGDLLVGTTTNTNSSKLVASGTISETVSSTQYLVASQFDIGTAPNEIPLNQYLGNLAYQDAGSIAGQVGLSAGTAALPSLVSATDTDTGMWFPAANTLAWSTGGARAMTVDSSQNVGIGTTSITARLEVQAVGVMARFKTGSANDGRVEWAYNTTDVGYVGADATTEFSVVARSGNVLKLGAGGVERARITSIGGFETRPAANGHAVFNEDSVDADFRVESDGNTHMLFVDAGSNRVGINSSSPASVFTINQPGDGDGITITHTSRPGIWKWHHSGVGSENFAFIQNNGSSDAVAYLMGRSDHYWNTDNVERLRISTSEIVANDSGANFDFRVESDNNQYMLWVDASADGVNIGGFDTIQGQLNVIKNTGDLVASTTALYITTGQTYGSAANRKNLDLVFQGYRDGTGTGGGAKARLRAIEQTADSRVGSLLIDVLDSAGDLQNVLELTSSNVVVNQGGIDMDFRVESDTDTHCLFVDASAGHVGVGINAPGWKFEVNGSAGVKTNNANAAEFHVHNSSASARDWVLISSGSAWAGGGQTGYFNIYDNTASAQRLTIDTSGNVGIGTANPLERLTINGGSNTTSALRLQNQGTNVGYMSTYAAFSGSGSSNDFTVAAIGALNLIFATNGYERARITSGGAFLIGGIATQIGSEKFGVDSGSGAGGKFKGGNDANVTLDTWNPATTGDNIFIAFRTETAETTRGTVTYNRTAGLVAYNTTSDYRAKDILGPVANSGATIDALKVYEGKMKGATQSRPMLVAHEAQEYAPYAVTGEKDAVNEDGTPKYQQMDVSSLVPLLLAEIQSLRARVAQLEAK